MERGDSGRVITGIEDFTDEDLGFACSCDDEKEANNGIIEKWYRDTYCSDKWFKEAFFVSRLLHHLESYFCFIEMIGVDQWMGVQFTVSNGVTDGKRNEPDTIYIEGDRFEDILLYAILRLHRKYGDKRKISFS